MNLKDLVRSIASKETTAESEVAKSLAAAKEHTDLNIFTELLENQALEAARAVDARIAKGESVGRLAGVPFAVKDNFLVDVGKTTASSNMLKTYEASYTASSLQKLLDEDAILIGKTNLDAFAHGGTTENSDFGPTKNPVDPSKVPGGSSGGSAAAVAAGIVSFTLGTDTGGSIRLPASFCGVVGMKPTYGLVSRYGVVAMASSTDCISPCAKTADDAAFVLDIIKGQDEFDGTTIDNSGISLGIDAPSKLKIGIIEEFVGDGVDASVTDSFNAAVEKLRSYGHTVEGVSLPSSHLALACYYVIVPAELSSNLNRYDGLRYGQTSDDATDLDSSYLNNRSEGFGAENKRRIMIGTYVLSSGYYDAYYKKAQKLRTRLVQEFNTAFEKYDVLISPVSPTPPFDLGSKNDDPVALYKADLMTVSASLVGIPAVSVPIAEADGLPNGLQIMAPQGKDGLVLALASQVSTKATL